MQKINLKSLSKEFLKTFDETLQNSFLCATTCNSAGFFGRIPKSSNLWQEEFFNGLILQFHFFTSGDMSFLFDLFLAAPCQQPFS